MNWTELRSDPTIVAMGQLFENQTDFSNEFNKAYVDSFGKTNAENRKEFVINALSVALDSYSQTKASTKTGRFLRFISGVLSKLKFNVLWKK